MGGRIITHIAQLKSRGTVDQFIESIHVYFQLTRSPLQLPRCIQVEEAAILASLLEQTEQLGMSVTDVYSAEMRERRLIRAQEKA